MSEPLVSVLIPMFNAERWIRDTLDSIRRQTWRNIEIVVVNDGSTDGGASVVRAFEHPRLQLLSQPNRGQTAALNSCLAHARGDFVQYLDADDILHPEKIERQLERLRVSPESIATCEWARFYGKIRFARFIPDDTWRDLDPVDWLVSAWNGGGGMLFPGLWLVPRGIVDRVGPWREDLTLNNDAEYFARTVLSARRVLFCEGSRAYYRSGVRGSLSALRTERGWLSQWNVLDRCEVYLLAAEDSDRTRRVVALLWQRFAHASYPYQSVLANRAMDRARRLHSVSVRPEGGPMFRCIRRLLGWKAARVLQRWSGRY